MSRVRLGRGAAAAGLILTCAGGLATTLRSKHQAPPPLTGVAVRTSTEAAAGEMDIGLIGDVAADASGRLYVLDVLRHRIGLLRDDGGPISWAGRAGQGPGEFVSPAALAVAAGGDVYVADRGNQRIERYAGRADGLRRIGSVPLDFVPQDLCAIGERLFALGARGEWVIHEISRVDGRVLRSFARDGQLRDPLLATHRDGGYLACGPGDEIAFLPMLRPRVHRYSATTGQELGSAEIPGYREVVVRRDAGSVTLSDPPEGFADCASGLVRLPSGDLLLQVGTVREGATMHEFDEIRSFVLPVDAPVARPLAEPLPRIVTPAARGFAAVRTDPSPAVTIVDLKLGQGGPDAG